MAQTQMLGRKATTVSTENGVMKVVYHETVVAAFNKKTHTVTLNSGGYRTATTRTRMNQAANQFGWNFTVFQKDFKWFVKYPGGNVGPFSDGMCFSV